MRLSDLLPGQSGIIVKVLGHGAFRKRVMEMGFVKGRRITTILEAPMRDPVKYRLMNYEVSLRRSEAQMVEIVLVDDAADSLADAKPSEVLQSQLTDASCDSFDKSSLPRYEGERNTINIVLIGNPNCGKTSLFNIASGAQEHVGNYSGVTVDSKSGVFHHNGFTFNIVDLPGTYSLSAYSPEEKYVRKYLRENTPDVIVNVVDGSNLERNLFLTTELIDMDYPLVIALNMYDELRRRGIEFDYEALGQMIGVPVVPTISRTGDGIEALFDTIISVYERRNPVVRHVHVGLGSDFERAIRELNASLKANHHLHPHFSPRYIAIKLMEGDAEAEAEISAIPGGKEILAVRDAKVELLNRLHPDEDIPTLVTSEKYGFIAGALAETMRSNPMDNPDSTRIIDALVTNRLFGFPIFLLIMFFIFWATFFVGQYPQAWIEWLVGQCADLVNHFMPAGPLKDLLANGIIGGVGGVIIFLPNILILFFFISFLEDSGYMSRAAFIMDKIMHRIGLHGKSFIPLIMGFGCNVPAVIASRSIESRSSKIITVLITPFMSCSARLPVYVLLIGTFFSGHAALMFMLMYFLGIAVAVVTAKLLRKVAFKRDETPFVMELPPYRVPTFRTSLRHTWGKGKEYLNKMGGVILLASVIVWALNYFPLRSTDPADVEQAIVEQSDQIDPERDSYLEMIGKSVNPIFVPLGFSWRATVAVLAGLPAKEIVVSTLGVLYTGSEEATDHSLSKRLSTPLIGASKPDFNSANALSFMVFILLYFPCIATVTAIVKETRSWRFGLFSVVYNTAVAWMLAFIFYRAALLVV